jgi:hypothetical protein
MTRRTASWPVLMIAIPWVALAAACGGPKVVYTPKAGVQTYPPVAASDVAQFESTPEKGSYIEMADMSIEDEIKCDVGQAFEEEKALSVIEELRRANPDMSDVTDITMLELLAEKGKIERDDICTLQARFTRKEEKTAFITEALKGVNLGTLTGKAAEMGANAIMKISHNDWQVKQKPSSFGADGTQVPGLKIGVKSTAVAIHYEGPEGGHGEAVSEKVLVVIKDKGEEEEVGEEEEEEEAAAETKETPPKPAEATKPEKGKAEAAVAKKEEKKEDKAAKKDEGPLQSAMLLQEAEKKAAELKAAEEALKKKQDEQKALKSGITKDKENVDALNKQYIALKVKAAKAKKDEEKAKAEEERKAKAMAKKLEDQKKEEAKAAATSTKEAEKAEQEAAKAKEKEAKKKEEKAAEKETKTKEKEEKKAEKGKAFVPAEGKEGEAEEADVSEAVKEAKTKLKDRKSAIFDCLHNAKVVGSIQVTFLFKPSGAIDALGFLPEAPESAHKCIMQILSKEKFPEAARYYKAIFKYTLK